ncbi:ATP-binding protein [Pelomicrobium methylotrophicum]|uniref:histidine kinase n=1 Tax=Pelomicrobium methylotrophicum TaxID=2602750 RepID=A0A5C7EHW3_9PROT|nr:ATP-binding protein [Pelomicrobium methylotrophicum]TXF11856.1 HAMP domain-containing protein [Pelomicrobium methylotrophicum]
MTTRWFSLGRRLLLWLLTGIVLGWMGATAAVYWVAREELGKWQEEETHHDAPHLWHEFEEHFLEAVLTPLGILLPALGGWIWFATRRGLAPLEDIAQEVARRAPEHLQPLAPAAAPTEIRPLVAALNRLFARVAQALENERRFTADAAHELRTPLAAMRAQAQVAQAARTPAEREHALEQIIDASHRAARLLEQLLTLARLDPAAAPTPAPVMLDTLAAEVCAEFGARALDRGIHLALEAQPASTPGNADLLRVLLANLVDNALRYVPAGGHVVVRVGPRVGGAELAVSDDGPGIPASEREAVLRRFHRLAGQDVPGSGLGLSIAARIVELHHARLALEEGPCGRGLTVRVSFPDHGAP